MSGDLTAQSVCRLANETFVADVEFHAALGSTNDRAKARAVDPACRLPLLVVAVQQTAGRGRGVHRWWSGPGSLTFSLAVEAQGPAGAADAGSGTGGNSERSPLAALVPALAVVEAVRPFVSREKLGLHWPNDVFLAAQKLSGVLVEGLANRRQVIGVGLNVNTRFDTAPAEVQDRATSLWAVTGQEHEPLAILRRWLNAAQRLLERLRVVPADIAGQANDLCLQRGRQLRVRSARQEWTGRCAGLGPTGALLLDTSAGRVEILSGTVQGDGSA